MTLPSISKHIAVATKVCTRQQDTGRPSQAVERQKCSKLRGRRYILMLTVCSLLPWATLPGSLSLSTPPAMAQTTQASPLRVITVTGSGQESIPTTLTRIELGVQAQGPTAVAVQQDIAQRQSRVIELLRRNNVDKLQTNGIRLSPQYSYNNREQPRITGYSGSNTISFELPTDQVGGLLDDAIDAGANQINRVSFTATDAAIATAQSTALAAATRDARRQADAVLATLGLSAAEVISIQVNGAQAPVPYPVARADVALRSEAASTPVEGSEQTVNARVTLQIRY
ncbi:MAG: SIMPL domain-containing protein [Cyanobacteria bacterium J06632_22]